MSGISDLAMRRIARRFGAALVFSEMVAAETFLRGDAEASMRAEGDGLAPHAVQLVGREAKALAETARRVVDVGAVLVDINMGCPSRRVSGCLAGAALMRDLDNAERLIAAVVEAVSVPVTVKMRLGWDETSVNAPDLAQRAERAGAQMATVHGRTRSQFYDGRADWAAVRAVVSSVAIPVVVNGDCATADDARADARPLRRGGRDDRARGGRRALARRRPIARARPRAARRGRLHRRSAAKPRSNISIGWLANSGPAPDFAMRENIWRPTPITRARTTRLRRELVTCEDAPQCRRLLARVFDRDWARQAA